MEAEDDENPPLAVPITDITDSSSNLRNIGPDYVGVTVITGYLGAGKSTTLGLVNLVQDECKPMVSDVLEDFEKELHNINSLARIIRSVRCQVDLCEILDYRAYDAQHAAHLEGLLIKSQSLYNGSSHDNSVCTICICDQKQVDLNKVKLWLEEILWEKNFNMDVYRCKGVLSVHKTDQLHTIQAVREIYEIAPACRWQKDEKQMNGIVFIGRNLDEESLGDSFCECTLPT